MSWNNRWDLFVQQLGNAHQFLDASVLIHHSHISLSRKFLYIETPKVACSTVKKVLIDAEYGFKTEPETFEYIHYREFSPLLSVQHVGNFQDFLKRKDIFKFCFVRNPYTRLLSCYLDKIKNLEYQSKAVLTQLGEPPGSQRILTFEEFVDAVYDQLPINMDPHWRTQYYQNFISGISYDFIGRFEQMDKDLHHVLDCLDIDSEKYYEKVDVHATSAATLLEQYYTPSIVEKVYQKFKIDFDNFDYPKELPG